MLLHEGLINKHSQFWQEFHFNSEHNSNEIKKCFVSLHSIRSQQDTGRGVTSALYRAILGICVSFLGPRLEFGIHVTVYWKGLDIRIVKNINILLIFNILSI